MNECEELKKKLESAEIDAGLANVYKDIIRSIDNTNRNTFILIFILSIFIIVLMVFTFQNQKEYSKYREESITKHEIIEMFESLKNDNTWLNSIIQKHNLIIYVKISEDECLILKLRCMNNSNVQILTILEEKGFPMSLATLGRKTKKIDNKIHKIIKEG